MMQSKIHRVTVTEANLNYIGSITIDSDLLDAAGSGVICLNGAAARKAQPGDVVIIMTYVQLTPEEARTFKPRVIFPDTATNRLDGYASGADCHNK